MFPGVEPAPAARRDPPANSADPETAKHRAALVRILQMAYSGELAAARAYNGHWKSVRSPEERARLKHIEQEELQHRGCVGEMLAEMEWEHELYFRAKVLSHPLGRLLPLWPIPPPKETIRSEGRP